jgi:hypothetical protein
MINEQENKTSLTKLSPEEYEKNQVEMSRYRNNGLTYRLGLLGMGTSLFACLILLNSLAPSVHSFIVVMINIVVLLGGFLACEKAKNYSMKGSIGLTVFGGVSIARIFYTPLLLAIYSASYDKYYSKQSSSDPKVKAEAKEKVDAALKWVGKSITESYGKNKYAYAYLYHDGVFRAIFVMVILGISGAAFIAAGVIGMKRSKKLTTYLESINQKD